MREARDLGLRLGLGRDTAISMNNLADGEAFYVGLRQARETWEQAIQFSRERGIKGAMMWQRGERLRCLYHAGEWDDALTEAAELLQWTEDGGPLEVYARLPLAGIHLHRGDLAGAQAHAIALLDEARKSGDPQVLVPGLSAMALVASAAGERDRALGYVSELDVASKGLVTWRSLCLVEPLRIAVAAGEIELAESFLEGSRHTSAFHSAARPGAEAAIAESRGSTDAAAGLYREAAERWDEYGSDVEQAYALLGLGRCGDGQAARDAEAIFGRLGARPVLSRAA